MSIVNHATGPKAAARAVPHPQESATAQSTAEEPAGSGFGEAVEIQLSEEAEASLLNDKPGNAANSPAHQARAFLSGFSAEGDGGEKVPFGQIVSRIARGIDPAEAFAAPAADETAGETAGETTGETGEIASAVETAEGTEAALAEETTAETGEITTAGSEGTAVADLLDELLEEEEPEDASA
ncbi:MAG: hypothetical protein OEM59_02335 [Rhodospirillales bacterium]|nr:hypothetical protein [Rhodospirillales bacterium]